MCLFIYIPETYFLKNLFFKKNDLLFIIPFALYVLYYYPTYNQSSENKIYDIKAFFDAGISWHENLIEWIAEVVVTLPFLFYSVRLFNRYQNKIKDNFSDITKINYIVVRNLIVASIFSYALEILIIILAFLGIEIVNTLNLFLYITVIVIYYLIGYDALIRPKNEIITYTYINKNQKLDKHDLQEFSQNNLIENHRKYEKNPLSELKIREISEKITQSMEKDKLYRNPEIRLTDYAQLINEHPNNVSQVLNDIFKKNFYDFINSYRVKEAKLLLKSPKYKNYTITAIGFEVGFNSKSSFYSAFKKFAHTTPAKYQKLHFHE
ncbi:MAG TPA: helix-turn-helix domain-containing protein [Ignavibacteriales bacterium]|nr:helix-turn-helix domain-containing protein [Ignavibacteriales bacterium]HOM64670.1 helix-turn-helix domain-containing protein [Ignavibacteriales bacterium]HPD66799.1 helix-turn-helix domain-containing protein [Ignavibacteriales bacterium]HRR18183.1 helix-turn-helix domain-containing protein [Ignavibacteriales bacterium]